MGITFTQRTDVWSFILGEIVKRPLTGAGFGSFWDIDPRVQPSLQGDLWFGSAALANEAHNGYLDLLATTGVIGFLGALALLFRWVARALTLLRRSVLELDRDADPIWPSATMLVLFPLLLFVHNFMESSYFTANQIFGSLALVIGAEIDMRYRQQRGSA
jgi:O-antigen ligase